MVEALNNGGQTGLPAFPQAVLFDLDGTLLDSAPDMVAAVNVLRDARGAPPMPLQSLRPHVSHGARAMVAAAFPEDDAVDMPDLVAEFLAAYAGVLGRYCAPFDGVEQMLAALEGAGSRWGIVTNKPEALAAPLLPMLGWSSRCGVLIGGDTLAERKPHPLPLLHAAGLIGVDPADCVYVGDDRRDIQAARAAGMRSVVALWGYRLPADDPATWQGDVLVETVTELIEPSRWPAQR